GDGAPGRVAVEAATGMIAERFGVDIASAAGVVAGHARATGRPLPRAAAALADRIIDLRRRERRGAVGDAPHRNGIPRVLLIDGRAENVTRMEQVFARWPHLALETAL